MSWSVFSRDMQVPDLAKCERCDTVIEWTTRLQKQYDAAHRGIKGAKSPRHEGCLRILPSKGFSVFQPVDAGKYRLPPLLDFLPPKTIVFDEAHALCNTTTKQSVAAGKISRVVDYVFPMSGTAITRDITGFW